LEVVGGLPEVKDFWGVYAFIKSSLGGGVEFLLAAPEGPSFFADGDLGGLVGRCLMHEVYTVLSSQYVHINIEQTKAIRDQAKVVLMSFNPFACPREGGGLKEVPDGIGEIKGIGIGVRDEPSVQGVEGLFIITADVNRSGGDMIVLTDYRCNDKDTKDTGEFDSVGVALRNRARDGMYRTNLSS
jgi:hypothetical protein